MKSNKSRPLLLVGGGAMMLLSGCGQIEQAATDAIDQAKQSAVQAIDEARQAGSLDQAREVANQVLQDARQEAAGLLGEASKFLSEGQGLPFGEQTPAGQDESAI